MEPRVIEEKIKTALPGAHVEVRDLTGGGDHFEAIVVTPAFEGRSLIERHQAVYAALGDAMKVQVHALTIKAMTPAQFQRR